jgi:hypothetical protein
MAKSCVHLLFLTTAYAVVRYVAFGDVSPVQFPAYILNKGIAFSSAIALLVAARYFSKKRVESFRAWSGVSLAFASAHTLLSLALWAPEDYPKLFSARQLNWQGNLTLTFGTVAACFFYAHALVKSQRFYGLRYVAALLLALHTFPLGWPGWFRPSIWPGFLPPISLLSFACAMLSASFLLSRNNGIASLRRQRTERVKTDRLPSILFWSSQEELGLASATTTVRNA